MNSNGYSIVPTHLAVKAMRDNGYKNAAYALAELMDNSIQAGATSVELLCAELTDIVTQRKRTRVHQIGVLDNGSGMDATTLRTALQFGNGMHLDEATQKGIGKFGMGLPASSISQCRKVQVWSWQNGHEKALYSYLDLDLICQQQMNEVPEPAPKKVPEIWLNVAASLGKSGTLVVWSTLDRLQWKTANTIIENSEFVVGRMYRRFINADKVKIRMAGFDFENPADLREQYALPNDPLYLMSNTSTPSPYDKKPMFERFGGDDFETVHDIKYNGNVHQVKIKYSYASEESRQGSSPGQRPYGKHAAKNLGVSIVRADRELELDTSWTDPSNPRDRWWGVEIEFPPALDEIFGVTNNKQHAHYFTELSNFDIEELLKGGHTICEVKEDLQEQEDPRAPLIEIAHQIQKNRNVIRRLLKAQTASEESAGRTRHQDVKNTAESKATEITKTRQGAGHTGKSDEEEDLPADERRGIIEQTLIDDGVPQNAARALAGRTISNGLKYIFAEADLESAAFFSVKQRGGAIIITLNTSHPAYPNLVEVLEKEEDSDPEMLNERLYNALDGLKLLLMAWARFEDEQPDGMRRTQAQDTRVDWGRMARQFLEIS